MSEKKDSSGNGEKTKKELLHEEDPERVSDDSDEEEEEGDVTDGGDMDEMLRKLMGALSLRRGREGEGEKPEQLLEEVTLDGVAKYIREGKAKNIVTMAGAGISTSAGIPDFRTPGTGLYDNLKKYNLPNPQVS